MLIITSGQLVDLNTVPRQYGMYKNLDPAFLPPSSPRNIFESFQSCSVVRNIICSYLRHCNNYPSLQDLRADTSSMAAIRPDLRSTAALHFP
jgi:hypothetical protein